MTIMDEKLKKLGNYDDSGGLAEVMEQWWRGWIVFHSIVVSQNTKQNKFVSYFMC